MKREIKFRVWDKTNEVMIYWYEIINDKDILTDIFTTDFYDTMQFTGELDRHKEELYECDLFQIWNEPEIYEIRFEHGCFLAYHDGKQYGLVGELANCFIKKIGNIFENQELLQQ